MILIYFAKSEATILHDLLNKYVSKSAPKTQKCQIVTAAYTVKNPVSYTHLTLPTILRV